MTPEEFANISDEELSELLTALANKAQTVADVAALIAEKGLDVSPEQAAKLLELLKGDVALSDQEAGNASGGFTPIAKAGALRRPFVDLILTGTNETRGVAERFIG